MASSGTVEGATAEIPDALLWVKDAPLFIDRGNLDKFYDAVVRPAFKEHAPQTLKISQSKREDLEKQLGAKAEIRVPSWLASIVSGGGELSGGMTAGTSKSDDLETTLTLEPISTPHRQLEQLTVFYFIQLRERLLVGGLEAPKRWQEQGLSRQVPRALALVDLPPGTKFIPMAAEFAKSEFVSFFDQLRADSGEDPPDFERVSRKEYWSWFADNFNAERSIAVVERASTSHGRIEWIDFRIPISDVGDTMHLHIEPGGEYNTGTFAYRLIRRSLGHGIRLVGTLKDGPDLNVLALYER
jgi:hypothetical protein